MNKQDNQEPNNQQPVIEDLTVNEDQAEEVIGGGNPHSNFNFPVNYVF